MADNPLQPLKDRTPLEVAKKPFMDELAKESKMGMVSWVPTSLEASRDVAAYSIFGYDPKEHYTGLAPLEAAARRLNFNDVSLVFRCDFITLADQTLMDPQAGKISDKEAQLLIGELNKKIQKFNAKITPLSGYKNLLLIESPQKNQDAGDIETVHPAKIRGESISKWLPKGALGPLAKEIMDASREVLENHEVNRVRIDLNENPASMVWLWGQGKKPKLPPFMDKSKLKTKLWSESEAWKGLALSAGIDWMKTWNETEFTDFNMAYWYSPEMEFSKDYRAKVRHIEEFDAKVVGPVVKFLKKNKSQGKIFVTSDIVHSTEKGSDIHGYTPILWWGNGVGEKALDVFCEKNCAQSGPLHDPGHTFITEFLKS